MNYCLKAQSYLVGIIILLVLVGCDNRFVAKEHLDHYFTNLKRSQFIDLSQPPALDWQIYPALRNRLLNMSEFDISLLDFLSLQRCDVGYLAGKRNSVLGRVMTHSQRFLYEVNIVRAIESCEIHDDDLAAELSNVAQAKRAELSKALANALFNDQDSSGFFSLSNGLIPMSHSTAHDGELLAALQRLVVIAQKLDQLPLIESEQFEEDLKTLSDSEYFGRMLMSLMHLESYLLAVSQSLAIQDHTLCGPPLSFLRTVFKDQYIDLLQPYMARLNSSAYEVLPLFNQLMNTLPPLPKALSDYVSLLSFTEPNGGWKRYQRASQAHAQAWSRLFSLCKVKP
ncbi:DUF3080 family protein [Marinomonas epiphytica]